MLDHPDFIRYKKKGEDGLKDCKKILSYVESTFNNHTKAICNHRIEMKQEGFEVRYFAFSSNDEYLGIIGEKNILIIDCRTGKKIF
jgi:hypothetical protein